MRIGDNLGPEASALDLVIERRKSKLLCPSFWLIYINIQLTIFPRHDIFPKGSTSPRNVFVLSRADAERVYLLDQEHDDGKTDVRRAVNPVFTQTAVLTYVPVVERTIEAFVTERDDRFVNRTRFRRHNRLPCLAVLFQQKRWRQVPRS